LTQARQAGAVFTAMCVLSLHTVAHHVHRHVCGLVWCGCMVCLDRGLSRLVVRGRWC